MTGLKRFIPILLVFSAVWQLTFQASLPTDSHYVAGVVEFRTERTGTARQQVDANVRAYLDIIGSEEAVPTDIIVFPESTLNNQNALTFVPDPRIETVAPCDYDLKTTDVEQFLVDLSCQARNTSKYVVVNLSEKEVCSKVLSDPRPCASNDLNVFNTNVVFDRNGVIISRYRKVNLYAEPKNTTYVPELGWFDTDFGVRFGHFVCFDILFYTPPQEMVEKHGITDFLFPTMWFSQLPFLTGVQFQWSWAYTNNVNLLAAGASRPSVGSTGSGIYNGRRGSLVAVMNTGGDGVRTLYVSKVPKFEHGRHLTKREIIPPKTREVAPRLTQTDIKLKRDYLQYYETEILDLSQGTSLRRKVCFNKDFCCNFDINWTHLNATPNSKYYSYRLGAYNEWRLEESAAMNQLKNCALFSCIGDTIADCGKLFPASSTPIAPQVAFDRILIEAEFPKATELLLMPNSLKDDLMPVSLQNFEWSVEENKNAYNVRFLLNTTTDNLLTFAAYGNYFDGEEEN